MLPHDRRKNKSTKGRLHRKKTGLEACCPMAYRVCKRERKRGLISLRVGSLDFPSGGFSAGIFFFLTFSSTITFSNANHSEVLNFQVPHLVIVRTGGQARWSRALVTYRSLEGAGKLVTFFPLQSTVSVQRPSGARDTLKFSRSPRSPQ